MQGLSKNNYQACFYSQNRFINLDDLEERETPCNLHVCTFIVIRKGDFYKDLWMIPLKDTLHKKIHFHPQHRIRNFVPAPHTFCENKKGAIQINHLAMLQLQSLVCSKADQTNNFLGIAPQKFYVHRLQKTLTRCFFPQKSIVSDSFFSLPIEICLLQIPFPNYLCKSNNINYWINFGCPFT